MNHGWKSRSFAILALAAVALWAWPSLAAAQVAGGQARAVRATVPGLLGGTTTVLADTGVLPAGTTDALEASSATGTVPALLAGESLHAVTIGSPGLVISEASLGGLGISVGTVTLAADLVMARARAVAGEIGSGASEVVGLTINGVAVPVSGAPNQVVSIPGGRVVLNEQQTGMGGALVNALHVVVEGVADLVVASATARTP